jgi:hypothetical protein
MGRRGQEGKKTLTGSGAGKISGLDTPRSGGWGDRVLLYSDRAGLMLAGGGLFDTPR